MAAFILAPAASDDLHTILTYVQQESGPRSAQRLVDDFWSAFELLASSPRIGRKSDSEDGSRWWLVHRYFVLYDPGADPLQILRVHHGARDLGAALR